MQRVEDMNSLSRLTEEAVMDSKLKPEHEHHPNPINVSKGVMENIVENALEDATLDKLGV